MLDALLAFLLLSTVIGGFRLGLLARLGSWIGLIVGFVVGIRYGPTIADQLSEGGGTFMRFGLTMLAVLGPAVIGQGIGVQIGLGLRRVVPPGPPRILDHLGGAAAGALGFAIGLWLLLPVLGEVPALARITRDSEIVAFVDRVAPEPPANIRRLRTFVAQSPFPEVFSGIGRTPEASAPPAELPLSAALVEAVSRSTVNVEAVGCGRTQEGSGFVVGDGLVATNAHVVAGTGQIEVLFPDGRRVPTRLVAFDDDRDVAVLAGDFGVPALPLGPTGPDTPVAVFGHPDGQDPLRVAPGVVTQQITATGRDIYGEDQVRRQVQILGARLRQGDSGGAVVDAGGVVVGQAFAIAPDRPGTAYSLAAEEVGAVVATVSGEPVGSGACQMR